jgi:hypothetical protein
MLTSGRIALLGDSSDPAGLSERTLDSRETQFREAGIAVIPLPNLSLNGMGSLHRVSCLRFWTSLIPRTSSSVVLDSDRSQEASGLRTPFGK